MPTLPGAIPDLPAARAIVSAFQAVHVLSLAHANRYLDDSEIDPFTKVFCAQIADGGVIEKWTEAVERYTQLKTQTFDHQLLSFSRDVVTRLSGSSTIGELVGPGLFPLANEFLSRNLGIAADAFGDVATTRQMAEATNKIHDKEITANRVSPTSTVSGQDSIVANANPKTAVGDSIQLPGWLEERATNASTLIRVLMEAVEPRLRREHPQAVTDFDWDDFKSAGTIAGCVGLALRLHVDVPSIYRTALELAMRASLDLGFPDNRAHYDDCARFIRESLLDVARAKRAGAAYVLLSMWVFEGIAVGDSHKKDPLLIAKLAKIYNEESAGYWV